MSIFEKIVDLKDTFEGKLLAVFMAIVLVLGMTNVYAFATHEGETSEDSKVVFDLGAGANVKVSSGGEYQLIQGNASKLPYVDVDPGGSVDFIIELDEGYELAASGVQAASAGMKLGADAFVQKGTNQYTINNVGTEIKVTAETVAPVAPKMESAMQAIVEQTPETPVVPEVVDPALTQKQEEVVTNEVQSAPQSYAPMSVDDSVLNVTVRSLNATPAEDGTISAIVGQTYNAQYTAKMISAEGIILAVPVSAHASVSANIGYHHQAYTVVANDPVFGTLLPAGDYYLVVVNSNDPTATSPLIGYFDLTYAFNNGNTPDDATQLMGGYYLEGTYKNNTISIVEGTQVQSVAPSYTLKPETIETFAVNKDLKTTAMTERAPIAYKDVDQNDMGTQKVEYTIDVTSSGNAEGKDKNTGRVFQEYVTITDTLTGLTEEPTVSVTDIDGPVAIKDASYNSVDKTYTFSFDAKNADDAVFDNQAFTVAVTFNRASYVALNDAVNNDPSLMTSLYTLQNEAKVANKPANATTVTTSEPNKADNYTFGYYQADANKATLNVQKTVSLEANGGGKENYGTTIHNKYNIGETVAFTLVNEDTSESTIGTVNPADGTVSFGNLAIGNYTLSESTEISPYFTKATDMGLVVELKDGVPAIYFVADNGVDKTKDYATQTFEVNNQYKNTNEIEVIVQKENVPLSSGMVGASGMKVNVYQGSVLFGTFTTDADGTFVFDADPNASYMLEPVDSIVGFTTPGSLTNVTISTEESGRTLKYMCDYGGFKITKTFKDSEGNPVTPTDFAIKFKVTSVEDGDSVDYVLTEENNGQSLDKLFKPGAYTVEEVSIDSVWINEGTDETPNNVQRNYWYKTGATNQVTVVKNTYGTNAAFENTSSYGTLKVENKNTKNDPLKEGFTFTYVMVETAEDGSETEIASTKGTISNTDDSALIPSGKYKVWVSSTAAGYERTSDEFVYVTVPAMGSITASFVHGELPTVDGVKTNNKSTKDPVEGAEFTLYKLNTETNKYVSTGKISKTDEGKYSFDHLAAGDYKLIETKVPKGYITPAYAKTDDAGLAAAPSFTIPVGTYDTTVTGPAVENVVKPEVKVIKKDSNTDWDLTDNVEFTVYEATKSGNNYIANTKVQVVGGGKTITADLTEGFYVIKETKTPSNYIPRTDQIAIEVDAYGNVKVVELDKSYAKTGVKKNTGNGSNNEAVIYYSNTPKPSVSFLKLGETSLIEEDGSRSLSRVNDALFEIRDNQDNLISFVEAIGGYWTPSTASSAKSQIPSHTDGQLMIQDLDPAGQPYSVVEVDTPESAKDAGLDYYLMTDGKIEIKEVKGKDEDNNDVLLGYEATFTSNMLMKDDDKPEDYKNYKNVVLNKANRYQIELIKWLVDSTTGLTAMKDKKDPSSGIFDRAYNAKFQIYSVNEDGTRGALVDSVTTGSGAYPEMNTALSTFLPAGEYEIVEIVGPNGNWNAAEGLWFKDGTKGKYEDSNGQPIGEEVDHWTKSTNSFKVTIPENSSDLIHTYDVGNTDNRSVNPWWKELRAYGKKTGADLNADGTTENEKPLNGVKFDVYGAYVDPTTGKYVKSSNVLETVTSGTVKGKPGCFLTSFWDAGEILATASAEIKAAYEAGTLTIGLILVEKGPLPEGYSKDQLGSEYFFEATGSNTSTSGAEDGGPMHIRNYRGEGTLEVAKFSSLNNASVSGSVFKLYRANHSNAANMTFKQLKDQNALTLVKVNNSETFSPYYLTSIKDLATGYYFLEEVQAPAYHNDYGTYSIDGAEAKDYSKTIGAIPVSSSKNKTTVNVTDQRMASLTINNWTNGNDTSSATTRLKAQYTIAYTPSTDPKTNPLGNTNANVKFDGTTPFDVNGNFTLDGLADGTYTLKQVSLTQQEFNKNKTAVTGITFKVVDGKLTEIGGEAAQPTGDAMNGDAVWHGALNGYWSSININHVHKAKLIVNMGYLNAEGVWVDGVTGLPTGVTFPEATFTITDVDGVRADTFAAASAVLQKQADGSYKWTAQGQYVYLDAGTYTITQTTVNDKFVLDTTPVTLTVDETGTYYLNNADTDFKPEGNDRNRFYNKLNLGKFTLYKLGQDNKSQQGTQFLIYKEDGSFSQTLTIGSDGSASILLAPGEYKIKETSPVGGFDQRSDIWTVTVAANTNSDKLESFTADTTGTNALGVMNAALTTIKVKKITDYPGDSTVHTVGGMIFHLVKQNADGTYTAPTGGGTKTREVKDGDHGIATFTNVSAGTYKIFEALPVPTAFWDLNYLILDAQFGALATAPEITVAYNNGALEVTGPSINAGSRSSWDGANKMLTVYNEVQGIQFGVKKTDENGDPITAGKFTFDLYNEAGTKMRSVTAVPDANGMLYFEPIAVSHLTQGETVKVVETASPSEYLLDDIYAPTTKPITLDDAGWTAQYYETSFKNHKLTNKAEFGVSKTADKTELSKPLAEEAANIKYTITPTALENTLPISQYKIAETGMTLYGTNNAAITTNGPDHGFTKVTINQATSQKVLTKADGSPNGIDSAQTPVYVKVLDSNNVEMLGWTKMDAAVVFTSDKLIDVTSFTVLYSDVVPAGDDAASVGINFTPGTIEIETDIDQFVQDPNVGLNYEVSKISNTATVSGIKDGATAPTTKSSTVEVKAPVYDRPTMAISKKIIDPISKLTTPSSYVEYQVTLKNDSAASQDEWMSIKDPVIVDIMPADAMALVPYDDGDNYKVTMPAGLTAQYTPSSDNLAAVWNFEGLLAPQEEIVVTFRVQMNKIVATTNGGKVVNNAYGSSMKDKAYSSSNPTGATFKTSGNAVPADAITACDGYVGKDLGQYVTSSDSLTINRSGFIQPEKSIATTEQPTFYSGRDAQVVREGDKITYRLRVSNDLHSDGSIFVQSITENLPFVGSGSTTSVSQALLDLTSFDANVASAKTGAASVASTVEYFTQPKAAGTGGTTPAAKIAEGGSGTQSFKVTFGQGLELSTGEVLTITYSITLPEDSEISEQIYEDSVRNELESAFSVDYTYYDDPLTVGSNSVKAKFLADAVIAGTYWIDDDRDSVIDSGEGFVPDGSKVYLYEGAYDPSNPTQGLIAETTTASGAYGFKTGSYDGGTTTFPLDVKYNNGQIYTVVFENIDETTYQYSLGTAFNGTAPTKSHAVTVTSDQKTGDTNSVGLFAKDATNVVNCGISTKPIVKYLPNDTTASPVAASTMPYPNDNNEIEWISGTTYTVDSSVPTRNLFTFDKWQVVEGLSSGSGPYVGGNTFSMPYNDVKLEALWKADFSKLEVTGYDDVYDAKSHGISIVEPHKNLVVGDVIKLTSDYPATDISATVKSIDSSTGEVVVDYNGTDVNLQDFLNIFTDVWKDNGTIKSYEAGITVTRTLDGHGNTEVSETKKATVKINPVKIIVDTEDDEQVYNTNPLNIGGSAHVANGTVFKANNSNSTVIGYAANATDGTEVVGVVDGGATVETILISTDTSITHVSESGATNGYHVDWNGFKADNYEIITGVEGVLTITPAQLYIETNSDARLYNALPLTAGGTIYLGQDDFDNKTNGVPFVYDSASRQIVLPNGETMDVWTTGTITEPGNTPNTWEYEFNGTAIDTDYNIPAGEIVGELVVYTNENDVIVVTPSSRTTYDGQAKMVTPEVFNLPAEYQVYEVASSATATHVDETPGAGLDATADSFVLTSLAGDVVYDRAAGNTQFVNVAYTDGKIKINPAPLYVDTESASKVYDGAALTARGSVTGFIGRESASFTVTGSQTNPGTSQNTYDLTFDRSAIETDYIVSEDLGVLEVTAVIFTPEDGPLTPIVTQIATILGGAVESLIGDGDTPLGQGENAIDDDATPLANRIGCWVHYYIILGIIVTAIYSVAVLIRRRKFIGDLNKYEDNVLKGDLEAGSTTEEAAQPSLDGHQPASH